LTLEINRSTAELKFFGVLNDSRRLFQYPSKSEIHSLFTTASTFRISVAISAKAIRRGKLLNNFNSAVERLISNVKQIPINSNPHDHPVVVISGDFFVRFSDFFYQGLVSRYAERGIILKPVDLNELILYPQYENLTEASEELSISSNSRLKVLRATLSSRDAYGRQYLQNWFTIKLSERYERNLRRKFEDTSLLISKQNNVGNIIEYASQHIHRTIYGESVLTVGKGVETINEDYDGLLVLGPFACLPFRISEAILKPICWKNDFPFLSYETDGRSLPPSFLRLVDVNIQQILRKHGHEISPHLMLLLKMA